MPARADEGFRCDGLNFRCGFPLCVIVLGSIAGTFAQADDLQVTAFSKSGAMTLNNAYSNGVVTVMKAQTVDGSWLPEKNVFSVGPTVQVNLAMSGDMGFYRPMAVDLSGDGGFTNLVNSFGLLTTIAGAGGNPYSPTNKWVSDFEGGPATNALLSRPHIAMADGAGNIYIADKEAHAIRKVTPDGNIHTVAGINEAGYGSMEPAPALSVALNNPNGLWVRQDGMFYILDCNNGLIRKVDLDGTATVMADNGSPIPGGRGLWVSEDESILFYCAGTEVKCWDSTNGLTIFASGFFQLGNLAMDPGMNLVVTDRKANQVFRLGSDGSRTLIAGGHDYYEEGHLATETFLFAVRGIWFLPSGAFFLGTDGNSGNKVWYVDTDGYAHIFLNGLYGTHGGDGEWFYANPTEGKVSAVRQITMDYDGNLIVTENDAGYVRKVQFLPCPH